jgi:hypothetical protein
VTSVTCPIQRLETCAGTPATTGGNGIGAFRTAGSAGRVRRTSGLAQHLHRFTQMFFKKYALATILFGSLTAAATVPAAAGTYGALAAGFWKDDNGVLHVTSATAKNYGSPGRAEDAAIDACFRDGRNCHVVSSFSNGGCGFISVGRNTHATR